MLLNYVFGHKVKENAAILTRTETKSENINIKFISTFLLKREDIFLKRHDIFQTLNDIFTWKTPNYLLLLLDQ